MVNEGFLAERISMPPRDLHRSIFVAPDLGNLIDASEVIKLLSNTQAGGAGGWVLFGDRAMRSALAQTFNHFPHA